MNYRVESLDESSGGVMSSTCKITGRIIPIKSLIKEIIQKHKYQVHAKRLEKNTILIWLTPMSEFSWTGCYVMITKRNSKKVVAKGWLRIPGEFYEGEGKVTPEQYQTLYTLLKDQLDS